MYALLRHRSLRASTVTLTLVVAAGAAVSSLPGAAHSAEAAPRPEVCAGSPIEPTVAPQDAVEEIAIDISPSTASAGLQRLYSIAALAIVDRAAADGATLRITSFGASGVGARVHFEGSFAPKTANAVYNLASANRARCWARVAVARTLKTRAPRSGGTDVAGALASLITHARLIVRSGGPATVTLITDGCHAPASSGPNKTLANVCGKLEGGLTSQQILRAHPSEFVLPSAAGVTVVMKGVGVGRRPDAASSVRARKLISFWALVCRKARARRCDIGSSFP
jgi:hypothetical protein